MAVEVPLASQQKPSGGSNLSLWKWLAAFIASLIAPITIISSERYGAFLRRIQILQITEFLDNDFRNSEITATNIVSGIIGQWREFLALLLSLFVFGLICTPGFAYAFFPVARRTFAENNIFILSAAFNFDIFSQIHQLRTLTALIAGFIGAYLACILWLYSLIGTSRLRSTAILEATRRLIISCTIVLLLWQTASALTAAEDYLGRRGESLLFVIAVAGGLTFATSIPDKAIGFLTRSWSDRTPSYRESLTLDAIQGMSNGVRRHLALMQIETIQNLATMDPLRLLGTASNNLNQIIDWVGQAQLAMRIDPRILPYLLLVGVRTILDLDRTIDDERLVDIFEVLEGMQLGTSASTSLVSHSERSDAAKLRTELSFRILPSLIDKARETPEYSRLERLEAVAKTTEIENLLLSPSGVTPRKKVEEQIPEQPSSEVVLWRYPSLHLEGEMRQQQSVTFFLSLLSDKPADSEHSLTIPKTVDEETRSTEWDIPPAAVALGSVSKDWLELPIVVQLHCPPIVFEQPKGVILLQRGKSPVPCRIHGYIKENVELPKDLEMIVMFSVDARLCATWSKVLDLIAH